MDFIIKQRPNFTLLLLLSCKFNKVNNFVTLASTRLRLPEDDTDALKHAGELTIYKICIYMYVVQLLVVIINTYPKFMMCSGISTLFFTNPWFKALAF